MRRVFQHLSPQIRLLSPFHSLPRVSSTMRTPSKRTASAAAEDTAATPSPRSSKRLRAAATTPLPTTPSPTAAKKTRTPKAPPAASPSSNLPAAASAAAAKKSRVSPAPAATTPDVKPQPTSTPAVAATNGSASNGSAAKKPRAAKPAAPAASIAARTTDTALRVGAHVSAAGGVANAVTNASSIGANAFALFLQSQRKWTNPPLTSEQADAFAAACKTEDYAAATVVVPHGSYLVNLAQAEPDKAAQAYAGFLNDLQRCERLGISLYNFHPGSTGGAPRAAACARVAAQLNRAHAATSQVVILVENMAGGGNVLGGSWADLGAIVEGVTDKSRVGVCLDTCHAFAAGYDLRTPAGWTAALDGLDAAVGPGRLRALHVNDSKAPLGSRRDLHANLGTGYLGLRAFHAMVHEPRVRGLPMLLETPIGRTDPVSGKSVDDRGIWAREIKLLEQLVDMDVESEEFRTLEAELAAQGAAERARVGGQVDRKAGKKK